jgi:hypothetical protein
VPTNPPTGASTFATQQALKAQGLTGQLWELPQGTQLPEEFMLCPDGVDVGGSQPSGHRTIAPSGPISYQDFVNRFMNLGWQLVGKIR